MIAYLPEFLTVLVPDYELQEIAYELNLAAYDNWALRRGFCLADARSPDITYYAARGRLGAGVGVQRGLHLSAAGVHRLLPAGLGKAGRMRAAAVVPHPFACDARPELDIAYAAYCIAERAPQGYTSPGGSCLIRWRAAQTAATKRARELLQAAEASAHYAMAPTVQQATTAWQVLLMAFMACLMHWPDVGVARRFFEGCRIIQRLPNTNLFRPKRSAPAVPRAEFLAGNSRALYEKKCQVTEDTAEIHDTLQTEEDDGFALPPQDFDYYVLKYGLNVFRAVMRFIHEQP
ncbi:MAG: hypothetical protein VX837_01575, partial [Candidatus Thermoplasmatota archaeon]|nr:hypothetical protein [Candidatus Thermoplasmatota archaeon]